MSTPESKEMLEILKKLQAAQSSTPRLESTNTSADAPAPASLSPAAVEMYNILQKLESATATATQKVLKETKTNHELSTSTYSNNSISVNNDYKIIMEKKQVVPGVSKTFYNILDNENNLIYEDVVLFESAMLIIKGLLTNKIDPQKIAELDERYGSYLAETAIYKQKAKTLKESHRQDLALAKYSVAVDKMKQIKAQIKRFV